MAAPCTTNLEFDPGRYANRYEIRKCQKCRGYLGRVYGVPDLCFADFCGNSNGYFGSDDTVDGDGNVDGVCMSAPRCPTVPSLIADISEKLPGSVLM